MPQWSHDDYQAVEMAQLMRTGQGGLDWSALPFLTGWLRIGDIDMLCRRLRVILLHRPPPAEG